jgi:hypothetical protein
MRTRIMNQLQAFHYIFVDSNYITSAMLSSVNDFRYRLLEEMDGVELLPGLPYLVCQKRFRVHPQKL